MKEKLQRAWARCPRLTRGWKTAGNFLLAALFLLYFWGVSGYDLPTQEMERERRWRQNLLPAGEVVMEKESDSYAQVVTLDPAGITLGVEPGDGGGRDVLRYPRQDGITVIPLPHEVQTQAENHQIIQLDAVLAVGLPTDAQTVWMDLTLDWGLGSRTWEALRGVPLPSGAYLFLYNQDELPGPSSEEERAARNEWLTQLRFGEASAHWTVEVRREDGSVRAASGQTATVWGLESEVKGSGDWICYPIGGLGF